MDPLIMRKAANALATMLSRSSRSKYPNLGRVKDVVQAGVQAGTPDERGVVHGTGILGQEKDAAKREEKSVLRGALTGAGIGLVPGLASIGLTASMARTPEDFLRSMALRGVTGAAVGGGIGALSTHVGNKYPIKRKETEKNANWAKNDLPWYTTAAGATAGTLAASRLVPKKYRAVGQIGGALLGTAAGLEGGKAVGRRFQKTAMALEMHKQASVDMYVDKSEDMDRGMFAERDFEPGEVLEIAPVLVVPRTQIRDNDVLRSYVFNFDKDNVMVALGYASMFNHSYSPNARYKKDKGSRTLTFTAIKPIKAGEEIFVNYNLDPKGKSPLWFDVKEKQTEKTAEDQKCLRAVLRLTKKNPDLKVMIGPPDKGYDTSHFWAEGSRGDIHDPTRSDYSNYGKGSNLNMKANRKFLSSLGEKTAVSEEFIERHARKGVDELLAKAKGGDEAAVARIRKIRQRGVSVAAKGHHVGTRDADLGTKLVQQGQKFILMSKGVKPEATRSPPGSAWWDTPGSSAGSRSTGYGPSAGSTYGSARSTGSPFGSGFSDFWNEWERGEPARQQEAGARRARWAEETAQRRARWAAEDAQRARTYTGGRSYADSGPSYTGGYSSPFARPSRPRSTFPWGHAIAGAALAGIPLVSHIMQSRQEASRKKKRKAARKVTKKRKRKTAVPATVQTKEAAMRKVFEEMR